MIIKRHTAFSMTAVSCLLPGNSALCLKINFTYAESHYFYKTGFDISL